MFRAKLVTYKKASKNELLENMAARFGGGESDANAHSKSEIY